MTAIIVRRTITGAITAFVTMALLTVGMCIGAVLIGALWALQDAVHWYAAGRPG